MPRRYSRKKKTYKRKFRRTYRKRKSMPSGVVRLKLRITASVASNAGGVITFAYSNNPSSLRDWTSISNLYDMYVVKGMAFRFIPYLPNDTSTVTGFAPLYNVIDQNSPTTPLTAINDAIEYENMRVFNMYRPWNLYRRFSKVTSNNATVVNNGYFPTASPTATGCVAFYGEGYDISQSYGTLIVTAYITAKNRK